MPQVTIQQAMGHAGQLFQAGRLAEAESIYRQVLQQNPNHADAIHCLGVLAHAKGDAETARNLVRRATELQPGNAIYLQNLGDLLYTGGKFEEAETALRRALQLNPQLAAAVMKLGMVMEHFEKLQEAENLYRQAIALAPNYAEAHCNLGDALYKQKKTTEAIASYTQAIAINPNLGEAYSNRGNALDSIDRTEEAVVDFLRSIQIKPSFSALRSMGIYCAENDRVEEGAEYFRKALEINPNSAPARNSLALAYLRLGRYDDGMAECRRAIECDPNLLDPRANLGLILRDLGRYDEAIEAFAAAERLEPDRSEVLAVRALIHLVRGDFETGFREYQARWKLPEFQKVGRDYQCPRWQGEDLAGRTIILWHEQGLGDTIHFVRYARILADRGARVVLEIQKPLNTLLRDVAGASQIINRDDPLPTADFNAPFLDLPGIMKMTLATIPADVPYLHADPDRVEQWRQRLGESKKLRVGIAWRGMFAHRLDRERSLTASHFHEFARVPGVELVNLQVFLLPSHRRPDDRIDDFPSPVLDFTDQMGDFADTAAVMSNLDLIIAVDTAVVHLAGALGRPTWTLLPFAPDWRWLLHREDSPWYPTMRLFRQPGFGDWRPALNRVARELGKLAADHGMGVKPS